MAFPMPPRMGRRLQPSYTHDIVHDPFSETYQDARYADPDNGVPGQRFQGPQRHAPREMPFRQYKPDVGGWWQGDRKLRGFKPNYYFTRPCDGKRTGTFGRLKDALTGEGPDVFITISGDKRTLMRDRPQKYQWSGWDTREDQQKRRAYDKDWRLCDEMDFFAPSWTRHRHVNPCYNFKSRHYERANPKWYLHDHLWKDATWPEGAKRSNMNPLNKKRLDDLWESRVPYEAGRWAGGRPVWHRDDRLP